MHVRSVVRIGMALTAVLLVAASAPAAKKKIEKRDDLPRHSYTLPMSGSEIVRSEDAIAKLAKQVRADLEADLASYDIADKTTVQGMQSALATISLVQHRWDEALEHLKAARALEDKPAIKATMGLGTESRIAAIRATGAVKAMAHITGGGLTENVPRVLPEGVAAEIDLSRVAVPPVFRWLTEVGSMEQSELLRTFNCGAGMVVVVPADAAESVSAALAEAGETVSVIGRIGQRSDEPVVYDGKLDLDLT